MLLSLLFRILTLLKWERVCCRSIGNGTMSELLVRWLRPLLGSGDILSSNRSGWIGKATQSWACCHHRSPSSLIDVNRSSHPVTSPALMIIWKFIRKQQVHMIWFLRCHWNVYLACFMMYAPVSFLSVFSVFLFVLCRICPASLNSSFCCCSIELHLLRFLYLPTSFAAHDLTVLYMLLSDFLLPLFRLHCLS